MNNSPFEIDNNPPPGGGEFGTISGPHFNLYSWMRKVKPRKTPGMGDSDTLVSVSSAAAEESAILSWDYVTPDDIQKASVARHLGQASPVVGREAVAPTLPIKRGRRKKTTLQPLPTTGG